MHETRMLQTDETKLSGFGGWLSSPQTIRRPLCSASLHSCLELPEGSKKSPALRYKDFAAPGLSGTNLDLFLGEDSVSLIVQEKDISVHLSLANQQPATHKDRYFQPCIDGM